MKPLVSVLLPMYNIEKYIEEAVLSILNQTYDNFEIIAIDDCSNDNTYNKVLELSKKDKRIKLYKNKENLKIANTLNKAFYLSKGEYILRMDGDDISLPDRLEKKLNFLMENPENDLVGCSVIAINENGKEIGKSRYCSDFNILKKIARYNSPVSHIWLAKREVYEKLGGYRNIPSVEDYDFLLRMITKGFKFSNLSDYYGYKVRIGREGNTINLFGLKQRKLHKLVYKYYLERLRTGQDSFNEESVLNLKINKFENSLYLLSSKFLKNAIINKKNKIKFLIYLLLSLISPTQVEYIYGRFMSRIIERKCK